MNQTTENQIDPGNQSQAGQTGNPGTGTDPHLAEWDRSTRAQPANIPTEFLPVIKFAESQMVEKVKAEIDKEVDGAITAITSDEQFKGVPKRIARGFLEAYAQETPEFKSAYEARKTNPKGWQAALETAGKGFAEDMKGFGGSTVRSDVEAAQASVRGTSSAPPPPQRQKSTPEMNKMSDYEFAEYKRELAAR